MLDRKQTPKIHEITTLQLPEVRQYHLSNGIPVYEVNMGTQDILKLEVIFEAGRPQEIKQLVSRATATMLKEGTRHRKGAEIAEFFDFYGASIGTPYNLDSTSFTLYTLTKHFETLLPRVAEILTEPSFPQEELTPLLMRYQQRLRLDLSRADVVAYRQLTEYIYGKTHPYGYNSNAESFQALQREDLMGHFERQFHAGNATIIVSGKIDGSIEKLLEKFLGQLPKREKLLLQAFPPITAKPQKVQIKHPDRSQSAIRIGRKLFSRQNPDYAPMYVLSTLFGGYFGSRLMMNIREKNGYTYGVYSSLDSMRHDGFMYIGTEVGNDFLKPTLKEIYNEMQIIRETLPKAEELQMLRNYLMGTLLNGLDGPFNVSELVKALVLDDLPLSYFQDLIHTIQTIQPKELRDLAQQYFKEEDMWEVVVGDVENS